MFAGCAHKDMTGEDHRAAAAADMAKAEAERAKFDPNDQRIVVTPRTSTHAADPTGSFADDPQPMPRVYNPSAAHLAESDRKMESAYKHLEAARKLEKYEDNACAGLTPAQRTSCPVLAPHLSNVEEGSRGVMLNVKSAERAKTLASQLQCHLAFSKANNFEAAPCPLFMKGVDIQLTSATTIEITSKDSKVAAEIRQEARKMFGENTVSTR